MTATMSHYLITPLNNVKLSEDHVATVGRGDAAHIRIKNDAAVSREHLSIQAIAGGGISVKDLGSRNGFHINRRKNSAHATATATDGDTIHIGGFELLYRYVPSTSDVWSLASTAALGRGETIEYDTEDDLKEAQEIDKPEEIILKTDGNPEHIAVAIEWVLHFRRSGMLYLGEYWEISIRNGHINKITPTPQFLSKNLHYSSNIVTAIGEHYQNIGHIELVECPQEDDGYSGPSLLAIAKELRTISNTTSIDSTESEKRWKNILEAHPYIEAWKSENPLEEESGDFIEVATAYDGSFLALVGDATGHGSSAARIADAARCAFRILVGCVSSMRELIVGLKNEMIERVDNQTMIFAVYSIVRIDANGRTTIIQGGTNGIWTVDAIEQKINAKPMVTHTGGMARSNMLRNDEKLPLNDHELPSYIQKTNDLVIIATDGITEATPHAEDPGEDQLEPQIEEIIASKIENPLAELGTHIIERTATHQQGNRMDDETIALFKFR